MKFRIPLVVVSLIGPILATSGVAYASSPPDATTIAAIDQAKYYVDQIHSEVFCNSAECQSKAGQAKVEVTVKRDFTKLQEVMKQVATGSLDAAANKFELDASYLVGALEATPSSLTEEEVEDAWIYVETDNLDSDIYVANCEYGNRKVEFKLWDVGALGAMTTISDITQLIGREDPSASNGLLLDEGIVSIAGFLKRDANGPNATFNSSIRVVAANVTTLFTRLQDRIEGKPTTMSSAQLSRLNTKIELELGGAMSAARRMST
jgi:hypothetical protein